MNTTNEREADTMKVSRNETIRIRKNLLREMDDYLRSNVNESTVEYI